MIFSKHEHQKIHKPKSGSLVDCLNHALSFQQVKMVNGKPEYKPDVMQVVEAVEAYQNDPSKQLFNELVAAVNLCITNGKSGFDFLLKATNSLPHANEPRKPSPSSSG